MGDVLTCHDTLFLSCWNAQRHALLVLRCENLFHSTYWKFFGTTEESDVYRCLSVDTAEGSEATVTSVAAARCRRFR